MGKKIKRFPIHPLAKEFPTMPNDDCEALREDIFTNGQLVPCLTFKGKIIDGKHRAEACEVLGIAVKTQEWHGKEADLLDFLVSHNLIRRHMTESQRAMWAARVLHPKEKAKDGPRLRAAHAKRKAYIERKKAHSTPNSGTGDETTDTAPNSAAKIVADKVRVNPGYIYKAQAILAADKALAKQVEAGEKTIPQAERQIKANQDGEDRVKEMTDPAAAKEKTEAGRARDRWFGKVLKAEIEDDKDWKVVVEDQLDDEAYTRLATRLRWRLEEEVG